MEAHDIQQKEQIVLLIKINNKWFKTTLINHYLKLFTATANKSSLQVEYKAVLIG
jgi:hypothetical protein